MSPDPPAAPRQSLLGNLLLSSSVVLLLGGGAELLARRFERDRPEPSAEERPLIWETGWQGDFYLMTSRSLGWPPSEAFNRDGVRDRTHAREKAEGVRRVVCLGDSVTLGPDPAPALAWPAQLQDELDAHGPGFEVMNVSLWGWSTRQERIAYQRIARGYRPDQVILGLCLNDVQDLQNNLSRPPRALGWLFKHSAVMRRAVDARGREIARVEELFEQSASPRVGEAFERLFSEIRGLRAETSADGASLSVLVFPYVAQVLPGAPDPSAQRRILAFCAAEGLRCVDLQPALAPLGRDGFEDGIHFTGAGNAAVAKRVLSEGLVPGWDAATPRLGAAHVPLPLSASSVSALVATLDAKDAQDAAAAAWALGRIGPPAISASPALCRAAESGAEPARLAAIDALSRVGPDVGAEALLLRLLDDARMPVRWRAAEALARVPPVRPEARAAACAHALGSSDPYLRAFAAWSLGELREHATVAVPALIAGLRDPDGRQRALVIQSLGRIPGDEGRSVPALKAMLASAESEDRWRAARALGRIGEAASAVRPDLEAARRDADGRVRSEAELALKRVGKRRGRS